MAERTLRCDCGFEVSSRDESDFVRQVQEHAASAHHMQLTAEHVLMAAFRSELAREGEFPPE
jgi:predicted small metal-binding protein